MAKAIYIIAVQRVIEDKRTSLISLIDVIEQIIVTVPQNMPPPTFAKTEGWTLAALLSFKEDEIGVAWDYGVEVEAPDGGRYVMESLPVNNPVGVRHRLNIAIDTFPVLDPGTYRYILKTRKSGEENWIELGHYPLNIKHNAVPPVPLLAKG